MACAAHRFVYRFICRFQAFMREPALGPHSLDCLSLGCLARAAHRSEGMHHAI